LVSRKEFHHGPPIYEERMTTTTPQWPVTELHGNQNISLPRHEDVLGNGVIVHAFLTSVLDGGERLASRLGRFTPWERAPDTHLIRGWVGPRAVLDAVVKEKILSHRRESKPRTPIVQPVA
jgi:hypothetical protein